MKQFFNPPPVVYIVGLLGIFAHVHAVAVTNFGVLIHARPLEAGAQVDPKLFGNFIELLDDVVPGMWAECLNDRSFEGVIPLANWSYYDGKPNFCDREWDLGSSTFDHDNPFNGARSVRLAPRASHPVLLTQSGLAVTKGMSYVCSGFFRADSSNLTVNVRLKFLLPSGEWITLGSGQFSSFTPEWRKNSLVLKADGFTDRAIFELEAVGTGSVWVDKVSLMPGDNVSGWRRDVVAAIKEVSPGIIRWGGSACDPGCYLWKKGIGDRDKREPFRNKVWGRTDPNDVGIDEFCQLCEATATEALVCLSFADGPQSAGDLVEYCNGGSDTSWGKKRAANGHFAPYKVKYWQVGNEISGDDPNYLDQIGSFIRMIKRSDGGARILSSYPSQKLLERWGKDLSYVCPHDYTPDYQACGRNFTRLAQMIDTIPDCAHLRIAVTEWNISGGDWGLQRGKQMTLSAALANAHYLNVLMRHSAKVEIACRSNMANSLCGAIFETDPASLLKRPSYYVMQLYARHSKPTPLLIETTSGEPDVFAASSPDYKSVVIFAVNSKTEPIDCSFKFEGFPGSLNPRGAESVRDTLNARQPDVMNHWEKPGRVTIVSLNPPGEKITLPPLSATAIEFIGN